MPAMGIDQVFTNCQSETEPTKFTRSRARTLFECLENALQRLRLNTNAGILDFQNEITICLIAGTNKNGPAPRRKFYGVVQNVPTHLLKANRVRNDPMSWRLQVQFYGEIF